MVLLSITATLVVLSLSMIAFRQETFCNHARWLVSLDNSLSGERAGTHDEGRESFVGEIAVEARRRSLEQAV